MKKEIKILKNPFEVIEVDKLQTEMVGDLVIYSFEKESLIVEQYEKYFKISKNLFSENDWNRIQKALSVSKFYSEYLNRISELKGRSSAENSSENDFLGGDVELFKKVQSRPFSLENCRAELISIFITPPEHKWDGNTYISLDQDLNAG